MGSGSEARARARAGVRVRVRVGVRVYLVGQPGDDGLAWIGFRARA